MDESLRKLLDTIKTYNDHADETGICKAYEFAKKAHEGQMRKSGEPYIIHPVDVAMIIAEMQLDSEAIMAGLLHDTVEDVEWCTISTIEQEFGEDVAHLVDGVTKIGKIQYTTKEEQQIENLRKMLLAMKQISPLRILWQI